MNETERIEIDGLTYICTQLPASAALKLLTRLTNILGRPMLLLLAKGIEGIGEQEVEDLAEIAASSLLERLDEAVVLKTVLDILAKTRAVMGFDDEGNPKGVSVVKTFDEHFKGKLWTRLVPLLRFSLEANYSDFFDAARSAGSQLVSRSSTAAEAASTGPSTSTNDSGPSASAPMD